MFEFWKNCFIWFKVGEYGKYFVSGMQGDNSKYVKVSSCCKHYAAYNLEKWNGYDRASFNAIRKSSTLR